MPRSPEAVGRAEFAQSLRGVCVDALGPIVAMVYLPDEDGGRIETMEAQAFRLLNAGMDEARFFVGVDPFAPEGLRVHAAGEVAFGALLPGLRRCELADDAMREAVKFVLRIPEDERSQAWERMKAFGELARSAR